MQYFLTYFTFTTNTTSVDTQSFCQTFGHAHYIDAAWTDASSQAYKVSAALPRKIFLLTFPGVSTSHFTAKASKAQTKPVRFAQLLFPWKRPVAAYKFLFFLCVFFAVLFWPSYFNSPYINII